MWHKKSTTAKGEEMKPWDCPECGESNGADVLKCTCGFTDGDKGKAEAINEGKLAFGDGQAVSDNPYTQIDPVLRNHWNKGWIDAENDHQNGGGVAPDRSRPGMFRVIVEFICDLISPVLCLIKPLLFVVIAFFVLYLIYSLCMEIVSWPKWSLAIIVLLILILNKKG